MVINEAIVLAGGLGTRLKEAVPDLPKCMAPINGHPFLYYLINHLQSEGITNFVFALGNKSEVITQYLEEQFPALPFKVSLETKPLGTGGAIKLACEKVIEKSALVVNGDTLFKIHVEELINFHTLTGAHCTLSLKCMEKFDRYGVVDVADDNTISSFKEKAYYDFGLINAGVYALQVHKFLEEDFPERFSFEKDYLEALYDKRIMFGIEQEGYFIDIGIPEDYEKAKADLT